MKKNIFILILLINLLMPAPASAISVVYNFRIAQITRQPISQQPNNRPSSFSILLFDMFQKTRNFDIRENYAGGLVTFNRNFAESYYFRADFAVAHAHQTASNTGNLNLNLNSNPIFQSSGQTNVIEPDDILLTAGYDFTPSQSSKITLSGLFGIPTHSINTLQRIGFGSGQVGVGVQLDGWHKFIKPLDFLWGTRYNYFVPRTAFNATGKPYNFSIGSIADLLIALQTNKSQVHGFEGGYSARWGFGVQACPKIANLDLFNYMRNSFYLVYKYSFLTERVAHRLLLNISYGFDSKPKLYGYNAVMIWGSWGIAF
jgi:hypothetical protein